MNIYKIKTVTSKNDIYAFHQFPFEIYKGDINWVPQIRQEVESVFDVKKNKYFSWEIRVSRKKSSIIRTRFNLNPSYRNINNEGKEYEYCTT